MKLESGRVLSHYRLEGKIGEGGMGEVWSATDTTLGRPVAIKILPEVFSEDPERLSRFEREARLLASLNHPNIAVIHGMHQAEGIHFLAMELVEGEDLARRIQRGAIPVEDAVSIARQVAEALEAAHESGVIHRDLKPANIHLTPEGKVKVLDFGLAKAFETESGPGNPSLSPTMTSAGTRMGMILGTAAYMSPEQARGRAVDRRADVWSFGCVLYEMLSGRQTFQGETVSDTLASVLKTEPDWSMLPAETPGGLRKLILRCLQKDPKGRLRDIGEARIALDQVARGEGEEAVSPASRTVPARRGPGLFWLAGTLVLAAVAVLVTWSLRPSPRPAPVRKFLIGIKDLEAAYAQTPMVSPDGRRIAYASGGHLWIRDLDQLKPREIPGSEGGRVPIWSPDGSVLAYTASGKLWRLPSAGGQPAAVCDLPTTIDGGAWGTDGTIVLSANTGPLFQVSAGGGDSTPILKPEEGKETDFHKPSFLPDGRGLIFVIHRTEGPDTLAVLSGKTRKVLLQMAGARFDNPAYSPTGHIVYERGGNNAGIYAAPFSLDKLEVAGEPFLLDPEGALPSVSTDGTLVFVRGAGQGVGHLVWVDRAGKVLEPVGQPMREIFAPNLSPDGKKVAVSVDENNNRDIWIEDVVRGTRTRLTFDPAVDLTQAWSPAGDRVFFLNGTTGSGTLNEKAADGTGEARMLAKADSSALSPDGKSVVFSIRDLKTKDDLWVLSLEGDAKPVPLLQTPARERQPAISPDGRYVAYISDESGRDEIYLTRFPAGGGKWQVSIDGGVNPVWARKSGELFFRNGSDLMAVGVTSNPSLTLGSPSKLFSGTAAGLMLTPGRRYDVAPDGKRILAVQGVGEPSAETGITLVENWLAEFRGR